MDRNTQRLEGLEPDPQTIAELERAAGGGSKLPTCSRAFASVSLPVEGGWKGPAHKSFEQYLNWGCKPEPPKFPPPVPSDHSASCLIRPARRANASFKYSNALGSVPVARKKSLSCPDRIAIGGAGCPARCRVAGRLAGCRFHETLGVTSTQLQDSPPIRATALQIATCHQ